MEGSQISGIGPGRAEGAIDLGVILTKNLYISEGMERKELRMKWPCGNGSYAGP